MRSRSVLQLTWLSFFFLFQAYHKMANVKSLRLDFRTYGNRVPMGPGIEHHRLVVATLRQLGVANPRLRVATEMLGDGDGGLGLSLGSHGTRLWPIKGGVLVKSHCIPHPALYNYS